MSIHNPPTGRDTSTEPRDSRTQDNLLLTPSKAYDSDNRVFFDYARQSTLPFSTSFDNSPPTETVDITADPSRHQYRPAVFDISEHHTGAREEQTFPQLPVDLVRNNSVSNARPQNTFNQNTNSSCQRERSPSVTDSSSNSEEESSTTNRVRKSSSSDSTNERKTKIFCKGPSQWSDESKEEVGLGHVQSQFPRVTEVKNTSGSAKECQVAMTQEVTKNLMNHEGKGEILTTSNQNEFVENTSHTAADFPGFFVLH